MAAVLSTYILYFKQKTAQCIDKDASHLSLAGNFGSMLAHW